MQRSHHCVRCGEDLTRVPTWIESVYGLPIVQCSDCGATIVRRRHPMERVLHRLRVLDLGLGILASQVVALALATIVACGCAIFTQRAVRWLLTSSAPPDIELAMVLAAVAATALGAWLAIAFGHLRMRVVAPCFAIWVCLWLALPLIVEWFDAVPRGGKVSVASARSVLSTWGAAAALVPVVAIGVPVGLLIRRGAARAYHLFWRRALRRARRRKTRVLP